MPCAMTSMSAQLEFRIFGTDLARQRSILTTQFSPCDSETRSDLYLIGSRPALSFKLRGGAALDLKELVGHAGKYEKWQPAGWCDLPAPGKTIKAAFPDKPLPDLRPGDEYDVSDLTAEFIRNGFRPVLVHKSREQFSAAPCLAEITRLETEFAPVCWTIAIEGGSAADLDRLGSTLELTEWENQSYPAWIAAQVSPPCPK